MQRQDDTAFWAHRQAQALALAARATDPGAALLQRELAERYAWRIEKVRAQSMR